MGRRLASGLLLAVVAGLVIGLSDALGLDLQHVALLGVALGGVLALVPHTPEWRKFAGFGVGFVLAWIGFALRAAVLPDSAAGRAVAAFVVVAVLAAVAAVSQERLPLWSGLIGAAAIVGAYEEIYTNAPSQFLAESPAAATTVLLAVALGCLTASLVPWGQHAETPRGVRRAWRAPRERPAGADIDDFIRGEGK